MGLCACKIKWYFVTKLVLLYTEKKSVWSNINMVICFRKWVLCQLLVWRTGDLWRPILYDSKLTKELIWDQCRIIQHLQRSPVHQSNNKVKLFMIKTVFAKSSFYENKVVSRKIYQLTLDEVPCFHKMKIMHKTVLTRTMWNRPILITPARILEIIWIKLIGSN